MLNLGTIKVTEIIWASI